MAAIALAQLKHLDRDNAYRRQLASWYIHGLKGNPAINIVPSSPDCESSRHLFVIKVGNRDELMTMLNGNEIYPGVHYTDNIVYSMYSYAEGTCPNARESSDSIISLPMHMNLSKADVDFVCSIVKKYAR
jgi:dTDP-4-amino-4,6-dideoxygalactose transaminase